MIILEKYFSLQLLMLQLTNFGQFIIDFIILENFD